jgi:hypothetical protein
MDRYEDTFDCYESHFEDNRAKCIACSQYEGCVMQKILDLLIILGIEEKWDKIFK